MSELFKVDPVIRTPPPGQVTKKPQKQRDQEQNARQHPQSEQDSEDNLDKVQTDEKSDDQNQQITTHHIDEIV